MLEKLRIETVTKEKAVRNAYNHFLKKQDNWIGIKIREKKIQFCFSKYENGTHNQANEKINRFRSIF